jgi:DNA-3-methyladenine glycosylase II
MNRSLSQGMPDYWPQAIAELGQRDDTLAALIARFPQVSLRTRGEPFVTLARSIVGQQISVKAADSVWARLTARFPGPTPASLRESEVDTLRGCGLSARKVEYLQDLAGRWLDGRLHATAWERMSDAEVAAELTAVRGIGTWTAEMFLIFTLLRPDVLPLDDIGLQRAAAEHYFTGVRPTRRQLHELGESWRPWRTVATWYLWRSLDPVPVEY